MQSIIICGLGTISKELIQEILNQHQNEYEIILVTRSPEVAKKKYNTQLTVITMEELQHNPSAYFQTCAAVVNLARPPISQLAHPVFPLTAEQIELEKKVFISEGAKSARIIAELCAKEGTYGTTVLLNASAYDHYPNQAADAPPCSDLTENQSNPNDFFSKAIKAWEDATQVAADAGIRVVHLGFGMVIDQHSTGFSDILSLFQLGIGGPLGSGEQSIPMVSMYDAVKAIMHCIKKENINGYVNITGFNVKQKDLSLELAEQIQGRPLQASYMHSFIKLFNNLGVRAVNNFHKPEWLIKLMAGTFGELLLKNVSVKSDKLINSGFIFKYNSLNTALDYALLPTDLGIDLGPSNAHNNNNNLHQQPDGASLFPRQSTTSKPTNQVLDDGVSFYSNQ